jgi:hypothetical protein
MTSEIPPGQRMVPAVTQEQLAAQQARLLRVLLAGEIPPDGFDIAKVQIEIRALRNKRRQVTGYLRPDIRAALGDERFTTLFAEYAIAFPRRVGIRARQDAGYFENWLRARGDLPQPPGARWRRFARRFVLPREH